MYVSSYWSPIAEFILLHASSAIRKMMESEIHKSLLLLVDNVKCLRAMECQDLQHS